ncbi:MAG TPA: hypothetical protein VKU01_22810 [Bryobacteraceae bacterium]|nr:hypothetical protein [Bryobacteraceae bacterium]
MRAHVRRFTWFSSVWVLLLLCNSTYAQSTSLSGAYGFLVTAASFMRPNNNGTALLGMLNFDGAGNVTGSYAFESGSQSANKAAQNIAGSLTGSYAINPDGTGNLTLNLDAGLSSTLAMVIASGGQSIHLVQTNCFFNGDGCNNFASMTSGYARAAQAGPLNGSYALELNSAPNPNGTVGVLNFDGNGNVTLSFTSVAPGRDDTTGQMPVTTGSLTGTYSTNPDGTGSITFNGSLGQATTSSFVYAITDGGSRLLLLMTDGTLSDVWYGSARQQ